jgi:4-hydroxyphenylpyruvate dioxygenase-like putative hemolysin
LANFSLQIFFGLITTIGVTWVYFFVPETKGRSLEEMDELFGRVGFAHTDAERQERIEREIGLTALLNGEESPPPKAEDI